MIKLWPFKEHVDKAVMHGKCGVEDYVEEEGGNVSILDTMVGCCCKPMDI